MKNQKEINAMRRAMLQQVKENAYLLKGNEYIVVVMRTGEEIIIGDADAADDLKGIRYNQVSYINEWIPGTADTDFNGLSQYTDFGYSDTEIVSAYTAFYHECITSTFSTLLSYHNLSDNTNDVAEIAGMKKEVSAAMVHHHNGTATDAENALYEKVGTLYNNLSVAMKKADALYATLTSTATAIYAGTCDQIRMIHRMYSALSEMYADTYAISRNEIPADTAAEKVPVLSISESESTDVCADILYDDTDRYMSADDIESMIDDDTLSDDDDEVPAMSESDIREYAEKDRSNCCYVVDAILDATGESSTMLLESLCRSLSVEVLADNLAYICRCYDIKESVTEYLHINGQI